MILEVILSFICGIVATFTFFKLSEAKALSIVRKKAQMKGQEAQAEQSVRLMAFITELKAAYDEEMALGDFDLKKFGVKRALPIALKFPDVIAKHGRALMKLMQGGKNSGTDDFSSILSGFL